MTWFCIKWGLILLGAIWLLKKILPASLKEWLKGKAEALWAKILKK